VPKSLIPCCAIVEVTKVMYHVRSLSRHMFVQPCIQKLLGPGKAGSLLFATLSRPFTHSISYKNQCRGNWGAKQTSMHLLPKCITIQNNNAGITTLLPPRGLSILLPLRPTSLSTPNSFSQYPNIKSRGSQWLSTSWDKNLLP